MTKPDPLVLDEQPSEGAILLKRAMIGLGGGISLVFMVGMMAGFISTLVEAGTIGVTAITILVVMALVACAISYAMWRLWPQTGPVPETPRVRNARRIMFISLGLGAVFGVMLAMGDGDEVTLFTNAAVSPRFAIVAIVSFAISLPLLTWLWWRNVDEHEADAYREGAFVAIHAYFFVVPVWWMASRAGWLPPQEPMLMLLMVSLLCSVVWFYRRYF
jgi:hypothetical protein